MIRQLEQLRIGRCACRAFRYGHFQLLQRIGSLLPNDRLHKTNYTLSPTGTRIVPAFKSPSCRQSSLEPLTLSLDTESLWKTLYPSRNFAASRSAARWHSIAALPSVMADVPTIIVGVSATISNVVKSPICICVGRSHWLNNSSRLSNGASAALSSQSSTHESATLASSWCLEIPLIRKHGSRGPSDTKG